ncbi:B3 domain-containing protein At4g01580 [Linum perenne]
MEFSREENVQIQELRFFKVILRATLKAKKLKIPRLFARNCGGNLDGKATLLDPKGLSWDMKIVKNGDDGETFWFKDGWQAFAIYYSLSHGDFVVFHYSGRSSSSSSHEFYVIVFDGKKGKEMNFVDYPLMKRNGSSSNVPQKYPSFRIKFTPSLVDSKLMNIPQSFYEEHMRSNENMGVVQFGVGRKRWEVQLRPYGHGHKYMRVSCREWRRFLVENSVKQGDLWEFKLVDQSTADGMLLLQAKILYLNAE